MKELIQISFYDSIPEEQVKLRGLSCLTICRKG